jgi:diacylglycerol kinase (ATP)
MHTLLLHNPTAGSGDYDAENLVRLLTGAGHRVSPLETDSPAVRERLKDAIDLIVIAGGDGTIAKVLTAADHELAPVTILPLGTANNIASSLGIDGEISDLVAGLARGRKVTRELGSAEGGFGRRRFMESVGMGALAEALGPVNAQRVESDQKIEQGRRAIERSIDEMRPSAFELELDGDRSEEALILVEISKIPVLGPQLLLAPSAGPADGLFQVVTAGERDRTALRDWLTGEPDRAPAPVRVRVARDVRVGWRGTSSHIDDAFHDPSADASWLRARIDSRPITVLVPGRGHSA